MKFTTAFAALLSASTAVFAAPVGFVARDVWAPKVLTPNAQSVWTTGGTYDVTWDLSEKPQEVTNPNGTVYLANGGILDIDHPLAENVPLTDGTVSVTIPTTTDPGSDYVVVLVGDSGNDSQTFEIVAA